jgi:hypothetical protein
MLQNVNNNFRFRLEKCIEANGGTITIIKFWTSNFCHIKKITLNHALLKLSHER